MSSAVVGEGNISGSYTAGNMCASSTTRCGLIIDGVAIMDVSGGANKVMSGSVMDAHVPINASVVTEEDASHSLTITR